MESLDGFADSVQNIFRSDAREWCVTSVLLRRDQQELRILSSMGHIARGLPGGELPQWTVSTVMRPLHALMAAHSLLFVATLAVMLFHPPDVQLYWVDRIAFLLLIFVVLLRAFSLQQSMRVAGPVTWPMLGLVAL